MSEISDVGTSGIWAVGRRLGPVDRSVDDALGCPDRMKLNIAMLIPKKITQQGKRKQPPKRSRPVLQWFRL